MDEDELHNSPIQYVPPSPPAVDHSVSPLAAAATHAYDSSYAIDSGIATPADVSTYHEQQKVEHERVEGGAAQQLLDDKEALNVAAPGNVAAAAPISRAETLSQFEVQKREEARRRQQEAEETKKRQEAEMFEKARVLRMKLEAEEKSRKEADELARKQEEATRLELLAKQKATMEQFERQKVETAKRAEEERIAELKRAEAEAFAKLELAKQKKNEEERLKREDALRRQKEEEAARDEKLRKQKDAMAKFEEQQMLKQMSEPAREAYLANQRAIEEAARKKAEEEEAARKKIEEEEEAARRKIQEAEEARLRAIQQEKEAAERALAEKELAQKKAVAEAEAEQRRRETAAIETRNKALPVAPAPDASNLTTKRSFAKEATRAPTLPAPAVTPSAAPQSLEEEMELAVQKALERRKTFSQLATLDSDALRNDLLTLMASEEAKSRADHAARSRSIDEARSAGAAAGQTIALSFAPTLNNRDPLNRTRSGFGQPVNGKPANGRMSMSVDRPPMQSMGMSDNGGKRSKKDEAGCCKGCSIM
ncbi:uncharacterized protein EV422DRAFT_274179 [Fimicolochytrium jonesii]|uniref:uncharacterized protein n=1 Tax=Fimicolochytrium jonesii TaxID=1396493 RepID=UPI0022FEA644|nr:uncharacterized protein EV422DRAFT_274179 [Fimicolochytrium jonesii]KAI8816664.1 hypothetical protein EV422DRAFT_274179 [Fimicolochytrium jonesii]